MRVARTIRHSLFPADDDINLSSPVHAAILSSARDRNVSGVQIERRFREQRVSILQK